MAVRILRIIALVGILAGTTLLLLRRSFPDSLSRSAAVAWWISLPTFLAGAGGAAFSGLFVVILETDRRRRVAHGFDGSPDNGAMLALLSGSLGLTVIGALFFGLSLWLRRRKPTPVV